MKTLAIAVLLCALAAVPAFSQPYSVGGRGGISVFSSGGSSSGLQLGPTFDVVVSPNLLLGSELTLNTQNGTPVIWGNTAKYLLQIPRSDIRPYVDGGFNLVFVTGGPYFGLQFGGGAWFPIGNNLVVPADIQMGPVFTTGSSTFYFAMTSGIRYTLP